LKLGNAQCQTVGYHSEEVLQLYQQSRDAALALDQQDEAAEAGIRMANFLFGQCRHGDVLEIGRNILQGQTDRLRPETLVHLWIMIGSAHCHMGDFQQSLAFSEKAIALDDQVNCTHKAPVSGADPAIVVRDLVEMASRPMGHLERSLAVSEQGMAIAMERGHLFSIIWASVSCVLALTSFGCYAEAIACADRALAICEKRGFNTRIGNILQHRGPALFELGDEERGLADIQRGVALWRERNGIFLLARSLANINCAQTSWNRRAPASMKPNTWPIPPMKKCTWRKSFGCAAAYVGRKVITMRRGVSSSAPLSDHRIRERASSS